MIIKTGCDIVDIRKFERSAKNGGGKFLENIFSSRELSGAPKMETLAGLFAAKEAVLKALELKVGQWDDIEITKNENGRPEIAVLGYNIGSSQQADEVIDPILCRRSDGMKISQTRDSAFTPLLARHNKKIESRDISISHDGDYAFATAVFLINGQ